MYVHVDYHLDDGWINVDIVSVMVENTTLIHCSFIHSFVVNHLVLFFYGFIAQVLTFIQYFCLTIFKILFTHILLPVMSIFKHFPLATPFHSITVKRLFFIPIFSVPRLFLLRMVAVHTSAFVSKQRNLKHNTNGISF